MCYKCREVGHYAPDCPGSAKRLKEHSNTKNDHEPATSFDPLTEKWRFERYRLQEAAWEAVSKLNLMKYVYVMKCNVLSAVARSSATSV